MPVMELHQAGLSSGNEGNSAQHRADAAWLQCLQQGHENKGSKRYVWHAEGIHGKSKSTVVSFQCSGHSLALRL